jgi:hypothetical protein
MGEGSGCCFGSGLGAGSGAWSASEMRIERVWLAGSLPSGSMVSGCTVDNAVDSAVDSAISSIGAVRLIAASRINRCARVLISRAGPVKQCPCTHRFPAAETVFP